MVKIYTSYLKNPSEHLEDYMFEHTHYNVPEKPKCPFLGPVHALNRKIWVYPS
jgi:hypothetical protein